jgi:hypothetical protein
MCAPSGDQVPPKAGSSTLRSSPPRIETRKSALPRVKSTCAPSGEMRGKLAAPAVSCISSPVSRRISQIAPGLSPRREMNATVRPSGETDGAPSAPEAVIG